MILQGLNAELDGLITHESYVMIRDLAKDYVLPASLSRWLVRDIGEIEETANEANIPVIEVINADLAIVDEDVNLGGNNDELEN